MKKALAFSFLLSLSLHLTAFVLLLQPVRQPRESSTHPKPLLVSFAPAATVEQIDQGVTAIEVAARSAKNDQHQQAGLVSNPRFADDPDLSELENILGAYGFPLGASIKIASDGKVSEIVVIDPMNKLSEEQIEAIRKVLTVQNYEPGSVLGNRVAGEMTIELYRQPRLPELHF